MIADSTPETALEVVDLVKSFGGFKAVDGVNLKVAKGTIHALIGPNGAGKTTTFNLLTKFLTPTSGQIFINGKDVTRARPKQLAREGTVRSFQISAVFPEMTVAQNVRVALQRKLGTSMHFWRPVSGLARLDERVGELLEQVGLSSLRYRKAKELSYGRKRALEIATTLALEPELLLLDEPTSGLGHEDVERITELIRQFAVGRTVLMVEHNLPVVATLSDRVTVLAGGQVLTEGDYHYVSSHPDVIEAYLGTGHA